MRFALDESFGLVRSAGRWHLAATVMACAGGAVLLVAGAVVVAAFDPVDVAALGVVGGYLLYVGLGVRSSTSFLAQLDRSGPYLEIDGNRLVVDHPVVPGGIRVDLTRLRALAIEVEVDPGRRRDRRSFEIHRPPGSLHSLDEPDAFLPGRVATSRGKEAVRLTPASLEPPARRQPNLALLFVEPTEIAYLLEGPFQLVRRTPPMLNRSPGSMCTRGLYLRAVDPRSVERAFVDRGVRSGFDSDDWRFATT